MLGGLGLPTGPDSPGPWRQADGWVFFDITGALRTGLGRWGLPRVLSMMEARSGDVVEHLVRSASFAAKRSRSPVREVVRVLAHSRLLPWAARALRDPETAVISAYRIAEEVRDELAALGNDDTRPHLAAARAGIDEIVVPRLVRILPTRWAGLVLSKVLPVVLGRSVGPRDIQLALAGLPNNVTTDVDPRLWDLARQIAAEDETSRLLTERPASELANCFRDESLPATLQFGLRSSLDRHGHHAVAEIDAGVPRWSDRPERVIEIVASYPASHPQRTRGGRPIPRHHRGSRRSRGAHRGSAQAQEPDSRADRCVRAGSRSTARRSVGDAEVLHGHGPRPRRRFLAAGEELVAAGLLDAAEDVVPLGPDEAAAALEGTDHRDLVARRRATYERELRRGNPPRVLLSDGTEPETELLTGTDGDRLTGTSASAGTVTGRVRVILDPAGAALEPGETLVAPIDRSRVDTAVPQRGGLVMEMGGPNSHCATVAREYGIPAVVGVPEVTARIGPGQRLTVHGAAGAADIAD